MRKLYKQDVIEILYGATLLGAGGGGSLALGLEMLDKTEKDGNKIELDLVDISEIKDNEYGAMVAALGSPVAMLSEDKPILGPDVVCAFKAFKTAYAGEGKAVNYLYSGEMGGLNTVVPMLVAVLSDEDVDKRIKFLDVDSNGRAVPELNTTLAAANNFPPKPLGLGSLDGDEIIVYPVSDKAGENIARTLCMNYGMRIGFSTWGMIKADMEKFLDCGAVTRAQNVGKAILAMICGFLLVCTYMILVGMQGSDLGLPTTAILTRAFGERGSTIASGLVISISCIGWFGLNTVICGSSFCKILNSATGVNLPLWISDIVWGLAMLLTAVFGIKALDLLNKIAVPALLIMLVYGLAHALGNGGKQFVTSYQPNEPISFIAGVTLAVSGFAVGAVLASDYTRYSKTRGDTAKSCFLGIFPASILVLTIGGVLSVTTGSYDLTIMFAEMGLPVIGLLCLTLAT